MRRLSFILSYLWGDKGWKKNFQIQLVDTAYVRKINRVHITKVSIHPSIHVFIICSCKTASVPVVIVWNNQSGKTAKKVFFFFLRVAMTPTILPPPVELYSKWLFY